MTAPAKNEDSIRRYIGKITRIVPKPILVRKTARYRIDRVPSLARTPSLAPDAWGVVSCARAYARLLDRSRWVAEGMD